MMVTPHFGESAILSLCVGFLTSPSMLSDYLPSYSFNEISWRDFPLVMQPPVQISPDCSQHPNYTLRLVQVHLPRNKKSILPLKIIFLGLHCIRSLSESPSNDRQAKEGDPSSLRRPLRLKHPPQCKPFRARRVGNPVHL